MFGNSCTTMVDSCQCMAKSLQYCRVKKRKEKVGGKKKEMDEDQGWVTARGDAPFNREQMHHLTENSPAPR